MKKNISLLTLIILAISGYIQADNSLKPDESPEMDLFDQSPEFLETPGDNAELVPDLFSPADEQDAGQDLSAPSDEYSKQDIETASTHTNQELGTPEQAADFTQDIIKQRLELLELNFKRKIEAASHLLEEQLPLEFHAEIEKINNDPQLGKSEKDKFQKIVTNQYNLKQQEIESELRQAYIEYQEQKQELLSGNLNGKVYVPFEKTIDPEKALKIVDMAPNDIRMKVSLLKAPNVPEFCKPKKMLLVGPPGTGKTTLIKAIASLIGYPCKIIRATELFTTYTNSAVDNLNRTINEVIKMDKPCVIGLDEMDIIYRNHQNEMNQNKDAAAALWLLLDKCEDNPNIMFIGTTNDVSKLPPQMKSRFDDVILKLDLPEKQSRQEVIKMILRQLIDNGDVVLDDAFEKKYIAQLVNKTKGCSIREIEKLVQTALEVAVHKRTQLGLTAVAENTPSADAQIVPTIGQGTPTAHAETATQEIPTLEPIKLTPQDFETAFKRLKLHRTGFRGLVNKFKTKMKSLHEHFEPHLPAWQLTMLGNMIIAPASYLLFNKAIAFSPKLLNFFTR